jgi:hypothetical protein
MVHLIYLGLSISEQQGNRSKAMNHSACQLLARELINRKVRVNQQPAISVQSMHYQHMSVKK